MGVHGLWKLLEPSGKPVTVETLENHVLAVDVSIWLHQLLQGYRDSGGSSLPNAHLLGLFHRVCKLLYFRIKPVFVFDGGVPTLKKKVIIARHQRKDKASLASEKARQQLLKNLLKQKAVSQVLNEINASPKKASASQEKRDLFELPPIDDEDDSDLEIISEAYSSESDDDYKRKKKYKDLHAIDVHSSEFKALPADIRHDILTELKEKRKENSWGKIHEMPEDLGQFSNYQMNRLLKRRSVQVSLEEAEKEMGGKTLSLGDVEALLTEQGIQTSSDVGKRIASDNVTRFLLVSESKKADEKSGSLNKKEESESKSPSAGNNKTKDTLDDKFESNQIIEIDDDVKPEFSSTQIKQEPVDVSVSTFSIVKNKTKDIQSIKTKTSIFEKQNNKMDLDSDVIQIKQEPISDSVFDEINIIESDTSSVDITFDEVNVEYEMNRKLTVENNGLTQEQILSLIKEQNSKSIESVKKIGKKPENPIQYDDSKIQSSSMEYSSKITEEIVDESSELHNKQNNKISYVESCMNEINKSNPSETEENFNKSELLNVQKNKSIDDFSINVKNKDDSKKIDTLPSINITTKSNKMDHLSNSCSSNSNEQYDELCEFSKTSTSPILQVTIDTNKSDEKNDDDDDIFSDIFENKLSTPEKFNDENNVEIMSSSESSSSDIEDALISEYKDDKSTLLINEDTSISIPEISEDNYFKNAINDSELMDVKLKTVDQEKLTNELPSTSKVDYSGTEVDKFNENIEQSGIKTNEKLTSKELSKLQTILEEQEGELMLKQGKEERLASTVTEQMRIEAQELLQLFGVPWVTAPMEAEAQCAFLDHAGLTQGTITDDSDVWLFGARKVYKNFFNQKKFVLQFQSQDIQHFFKLSRGDLIELALLVGSDYTVGVNGIGPVTALEILAMFRPSSQNDTSVFSKLAAFKSWLQHPSNSSSPLARKLKDVRLEEGFPNKDVIEAYLHPLVDESKEPFTWGTPNLDSLREFTKRKFGWNQKRADEILLPVIKNLSQKTSQTKLDSFFRVMPGIPVYQDKVSQRVQKAIHRLGGESDEILGQFGNVAGPSGQNRNQPRNRRGTQKKRGSGRGRGSTLEIEPPPPPIPPILKTDEVIPQRERDRLVSIKRRLKAIEVMKAKRTKNTKKRPPRGNIKNEANLSESSSDEN